MIGVSLINEFVFESSDEYVIIPNPLVLSHIIISNNNKYAGINNRLINLETGAILLDGHVIAFDKKSEYVIYRNSNNTLVLFIIKTKECVTFTITMNMKTSICCIYNMYNIFTYVDNKSGSYSMNILDSRYPTFANNTSTKKPIFIECIEEDKLLVVSENHIEILYNKFRSKETHFIKNKAEHCCLTTDMENILVSDKINDMYLYSIEDGILLFTFYFQFEYLTNYYISGDLLYVCDNDHFIDVYDFYTQTLIERKKYSNIILNFYVTNIILDDYILK